MEFAKLMRISLGAHTLRESIELLDIRLGAGETSTITVQTE